MKTSRLFKPRTAALTWANFMAGCLLLILSCQLFQVDGFVLTSSTRGFLPQSKRGGIHQEYHHQQLVQWAQNKEQQDLVESSSPKDDDYDVSPLVSDEILAKSYRLVAESDPEWFSAFVVSTLTEHSKDDSSLDIPRSLQELIQQFENGEIIKPKEEEAVVEETPKKQRIQDVVVAPIEPKAKPDPVVPDAVILEEKRTKPTPTPATIASKQDDNVVSSSTPGASPISPKENMAQESTQSLKEPIKSTQNAAPKQSTKQQQKQQVERPSFGSGKPAPTILDDMYEGIRSVFGQSSTPTSKSTKAEQKRDKSTAKDAFVENDERPSPNVVSKTKKVETTKPVKPVETILSAFTSTSTTTAKSTPTIPVDAKPAKSTTTIPADTKPVGTADEKVKEEEPKEERVVLFRARQSKPFKQVPLAKLRELGFTKDDEITYLDPEALGLILSDNVCRPKKGVPSYWKIQDGGLGEVRIVDAMEAQQLLGRGSKPLSPPQRPSTPPINPKAESISEPKPTRQVKENSPSRISEVKENSQARSLDPKSDAKVPLQKAGESSVADTAAWNSFGRGPEAPRKRRDANFGTKQQSIPEQPKPQVSESESQTNKMETPNDPEYPATPEENRRFVVYRSENAKSRFKKVSLDRLEALGYQEKDVRSLLSDALAFIVAENVSKPKRGIPPNWKAEEGSDTAGDEQKGVRILEAAEAVAFLTNIPNRQEERKRRRPKDTAGEEMQQRTASTEDVDRRRSRRDRPASIDDEQDRRGRRDRPVSIDDEPDRREKRRRSAYTDEGQPKPIYSGRQPSLTDSKITRRPDPPKPAGFWPDIDTFRSLLREEAKLRVSLVGDGMADAVKSECDWRLQLYKDWLWTLHDGVGSPIVESRSDRARRMGDLPPPPPPPSKKSRREKPKSRQRTREE